MTSGLSKSLLRTVAVMATLFAGIFGLSFLVIRSDFSQRDCHIIPPTDWVYTANCADAYNGMRFTGFVAFVCLLALCWSVWNLRHA
jgi:hypothetical protein